MEYRTMLKNMPSVIRILCLCAAGCLAVGASADTVDTSSFDSWSSLVRRAPVSPIKPTADDISRSWQGADSRRVTLVVQQPRIDPGAASVTVPSVPTGQDAYGAFRQAIDQVRQQGAHILIVPPGLYVFKSSGPQAYLDLTGLSDVAVKGTGATLEFSADHPGIYLAADNRVKLTGLTLKYGLHLASLGEIRANESGNILVISDQYPVSQTDHVTYAAEYDDATHTWVKGGKRLIFSASGPDTPQYVGHQSFSSPLFSQLHDGQKVLVLHYFYGSPAIQIKDLDGQPDSQDIILDGIHINSAPGMGIAASKMKRGLAVLNSVIGTEPGGIISTEVDAIHTVAVGGDILIEGNRISEQGDDGINLASQIFPLLSVGPDQHTIVVGNFSRFIAAGDRLAIFAPDGQLTAYADVKTKGQQTPAGTVQFTTAESLPDIQPHSVVRDVTATEGRFAVIRNQIGHCNCHGVLAQIPNGLIAENSISHIKYNAIRIVTNVPQWKEGIGGFNIVVRDNTILDTGVDNSVHFPFGAISAYGVFYNGVSANPTNDYILIDHNNVTNASQACISMASSRHVTISHNVCSSVNMLYPNNPAISVSGDDSVKVIDTPAAGAPPTAARLQ
jgi:hypothetical protein